MSLKDLFNKKSDVVVLPKTSLEDVGTEIESPELVRAVNFGKERYIPNIDFSSASNFCRYGSAKQYYEDSISRVYLTFPYDGSLREKEEWYNSSSFLDLYIFENEYPRSTGYVTLAKAGYGTETATSSIVFSFVRKFDYDEFIEFHGGPHSGTFYSSEYNRGNNLQLNFDSGTTIEFWAKKASFLTASAEFVFSCANSASFGDGDFGYLISGFVNTSSAFPNLFCAAGSGSTNSAFVFTSSGLSSTDYDWHHFAFTLKNDDSNLIAKFYVDGQFKEEATGNLTSEITGAMVGRIGASVPFSTGGLRDGYGKFSGSLDEFRFWKTERSTQDVGRYWNSNIGAGTNTDEANTELGIYFKFNEGITLTSSVDSSILDYSGRLSNGTWTGYTYGERNTGSAIEDAEFTEFHDPIVYPFHNDVIALLNEKLSEGETYDYQNPSSLYFSLPGAIVEEDQANGKLLLKLTQILASYLDTLHSQIEFMPSIHEASYASGSGTPNPFTKNLLISDGLAAPELFEGATILEELLSRNEELSFEQKINEIKNLIYSNIYNNLVYIYKQKGTEEAFRNILRCFGVDEELININYYAKNVTYTFEDNFKLNLYKPKSINFDLENNNGATVVSFAESGNANSIGYISPISGSDHGRSFQIEFEGIFPKRFSVEDGDLYRESTFLVNSLFGICSTSGSNDTTVTDPNSWDVDVKLVRPQSFSRDGYFELSSSNFGVLTSSLISNIYDEQKWNLAVSLYPEKFPLASFITGTNANYVVEFFGVNSYAGEVSNKFLVSSSVVNATAEAALASNGRIFVGAKRENLTGNLLLNSDVRATSVRAFSTILPSGTIESHAKDSTKGSGIERTYNNTFLFEDAPSNFLSRAESLILHWNFETVTSSDTGGNFVVPDFSFGNANTVIEDKFRIQHTAMGFSFPTSSSDVVRREYIASSKLMLPDNIFGNDMVNIISSDEEEENQRRDFRPINFFVTFEKSPYRIISEEMINFFSTIRDFDNLIGEPIQKYRMSYKGLDHLRQIFFNRVSNSIDVHKFMKFYQWIDNALSKILIQFVPASAETSDKVLNVIESHIFERNKIQHNFPNFVMIQREPEAGANGINEENWRYNHAPISLSENENCNWWNQRAERDKGVLSSSISGSNFSRTKILEATLSALERKKSTPLKLSFDKQRGTYSELKTTEIPKSIIVPSFPITKSCIDDDELDLFVRSKLDENNLIPYSGFSGSIRHHHIDTYGKGIDAQMQGPFTSDHVGGLPYRHNEINTSERIEGWQLTPNIEPIENRVITYRDGMAKRPINVANISGSNYNFNYEIIQTCGRNENNLTKNDFTFNNSPHILRLNLVTSSWALPTRTKNKSIFVNRFNAPGGKEVNSRGYLDPVSEEMSINNAMPWRNLYVRMIDLIMNQVQHTNWGGYNSIYGPSSDIASEHKVYRNPNEHYELSASSETEVSLTENYDNNLVSHNIPMSDASYTWIHNIHGTPTSSFDYSSISGTYPMMVDYNMISQLRENSASIKEARSNRMSIVVPSRLTNQQEQVRTYTEPPVLSKYHPIEYKIETTNGKIMKIRSSYMNNKSYFANRQIDSMLNINHINENKKHHKFVEVLTSSNLQVREIRYHETIFPAPQNTYISSTRGRLEYEESIGNNESNGIDRRDRRTFWKNDANERGIGQTTPWATGSQNQDMSSVTSPSCWPLDGLAAFAIGNTGELMEEHSLQYCASNDFTSTNSPQFLDWNPVTAMIIDPVYPEQTIFNEWPYPFYNSYNYWNADLYIYSKAFSIMAEHRISQHMDYYQFTPFKNNSQFLEVVGGSITSSAETRTGSINNDFFKLYVYSDEVENRSQYELNNFNSLKFEFKAIKKLLPYNGFYPSTRAVQLATLFSQSLAPYITGTKNGTEDKVAAWQCFLQAFMAPGLLFNSIKSGLAIDYPIYKEIIPYALSGSITSSASYRLPFETLVDLTKIPKTSSIYLTYNHDFDLEPNITGTYGIWNGQKNNLYELGMHNFLAEIPDFFLQNEKISAIISKPESSFESLIANKTYYMDIVLYRTDDFAMCQLTSSSNYKGHLFGPAIQHTASYSVLDYMQYDPAYAPYTPPYFYGTASARISFTPNESKKYSLSEIFASSSIYYQNSYIFSKSVGDSTIYPAELGMMHISSSINLLGKTRLNAMTWNAISGEPVEMNQLPNSDFDVWSISPKWECPALHVSGSSDGSQVLWIQPGILPEPSSGIFLEVRDSFEPQFYIGGATGSLLDVCGFKETEIIQKIGKVADQKEINEAIIAIPFIEQDGSKEFISINNAVYHEQKLKVERNEPISSSIANMIKNMKKYVIPPQYNFIENTAIKPFVMYIFEFTTILSQEDLVNIWQGKMPQCAINLSQEVVSISHKINERNEFFENGLPQNLKFMIFKIKKKAKWNYFKMTIDSQDDDRLKTQFRIRTIPKYSYNWPYDFFSLVELGNMNIEFKYIEEEQIISSKSKTFNKKDAIIEKRISRIEAETTKDTSHSAVQERTPNFNGIERETSERQREETSLLPSINPRGTRRGLR